MKITCCMLHVALQTSHFCSNRRVGKVIFHRVAVELVIIVHVFSYKAIAVLKVMVHGAICNDDF